MKRVIKHYKPLIPALMFAAACFYADAGGAVEFDSIGRVEAMGKDNVIQLLLETPPTEKTYYIVYEKSVFGSVEIVSVVYVRNGRYRHRAVGNYTVTNKMYERQIRAGDDIALIVAARPVEGKKPGTMTGKETAYRDAIESPKDHKEMLLVPDGKFIFGSNDGDRDESPEQEAYLDRYYIDKYEVSNIEYEKFVDLAGARSPRSWVNGGFGNGEGDLPVMVTYYEADAYAKWAGKRLPSELEWEKAARGTGRGGRSARPGAYAYPWGVKFNPEFANCADFWADEKTGAHIKLRFVALLPGLMPVNSFDPEGASPYGVVNMAGNAREWTSSWYMPYKGNGSKQGKEFRRYGKQYKVVRGGSSYSPRFRARVTSREIGGMPNLHEDNLAGFRCVKDAVEQDKILDDAKINVDNLR